MLHDIRQLIISSRPISWVNTAYPFVAGYLVATHQLTLTTVIGGLYFLIPYNLMMYGINDVFDYESDLRNPRKGGIEGALLSRHLHRVTIISSIALSVPFIVYLLLQGSLVSKLVLIYVVFMVLAYSMPVLRFKERPFLDSFTSSTHFVGPLVYALVLTGWHTKYWPYVLAFFAWGMASHAFGAVQDIIADREAKIASIGTVLGAHKTVIFAAGMYLVSSVLLATRGPSGLAVACLGLLYSANVLRFWQVTDKTAEQAHDGWRTFLWLNQLSGFVITVILILYFRNA